jgi:hypothetical protein
VQHKVVKPLTSIKRNKPDAARIRAGAKEDAIKTGQNTTSQLQHYPFDDKNQVNDLYYAQEDVRKKGTVLQVQD